MTKEEKKAIEHLGFLKDNFNPPNYVWFLKDVEALDVVLNLINKQQEEIDKYKRYFKLAISDLQSEGYMQMPFKNIENYYSKREDIV